MSENRTKLQLRSPKHKKALSSLINTNFNFKTFHSPTFSGVTTSKIYTPNLTKVENFITKFQSSHPKFTKSLVNDKVSLILKSSSHNKLNQIKQKEMKKAYNAWAFSTQMESSMIILPENLETLKTSVGFHHFQLSQNEEEKVPFPLDLPMNMKNILKKQLDFNDKQASILKHSLDDIQREKFLKLIALIKKNHQLSIKFINHTLKIRKSSYVNTFENPPENDFIEKIESIGDEEYVTPCYRFFVNLIDSQDPANKPVIRESATLNIVNSKGYLFGGLSSKVLNTLDEINSKNWKWKRIELKSDREFEGRFGHTTLAYRNCLVLYGGEKKYNEALKTRECFNDVRYFNIETKEWKFLRTRGDFVEGRRNHAGVMLSKIMLVYGGMNGNGKCLNDLVALNIETQKWMICEVHSENSLMDETIAFHTMCAVFRVDIKVSSIYHPFEYLQINKKDISTRNIQEEGIYVFGGKNKSNEVNNILKILKIGKKPLVWIQPTTCGVCPSPRYQHSMSFQENFEFLIVYGGRNDNLGILGDLFVLNLRNMNWFQVNVHGRFKEKERFGHCSASISNKFLVFGGVNGKGFSSGDLLVFELNPKFVARQINEDKAKEKLIRSSSSENNLKNELSNEITAKDAQLENKDNKDNKENKEHEKQLILDSLNFKKFQTYMPIAHKEEDSIKKKSMEKWKKTLGTVKFLVKIQQKKPGKV